MARLTGIASARIVGMHTRWLDAQFGRVEAMLDRVGLQKSC
jgi:hypothetical protein